MHSEFITSAANAAGFPKTNLPEFAFVGRSNVGKSSLLNKLARANIARTSKTPGRTQLVNFFKVRGGDFEFVLADLPGYGFARAPRPVRRSWYTLLETYLTQRKPLRAVLQLVDLRREIEPEDLEVHRWLAGSKENVEVEGLGHRVILVGTKADKLPKSKRKPKIQSLAAKLAIPRSNTLVCSSLDQLGVQDLRDRLIMIAEQ